jgi:acetyl esterase/lipase
MYFAVPLFIIVIMQNAHFQFCNALKNRLPKLFVEANRFQNHIDKVLPSSSFRKYQNSMPFSSPVMESLQGSFVESRSIVDTNKNVNIHYEYYSKEGNAKMSPSTPLVIFVHGGAWKFGNSRNHYQIPLLEKLLDNNIDVISCNYRKELWPIPLNDVAFTFDRIQETYGQNNRRIVFFGTSAGGHLAIMAYYYSFLAMQPNSTLPPENKNHRMLLFYPAIDVFNQLKQKQILFPNHKVEDNKRQPVTLLSSFFETFVTEKNKGSKVDKTYPWISPIELVENAPLETWSKWPSTMIVHGKQDMITLYQCSEYFIESINFFSGDEKRHSLIGVDGSHNFDIPGCPTTRDVYKNVIDWIKNS